MEEATTMTMTPPATTIGATRRKTIGMLSSMAALGATGVLAACGAGDNRAGTALDAKTPAKVRYLTWWALERTTTIDDWKSGLKEEWPNITVDTEHITLGDYNTKFQVMLSSGTPPDVVLQNSHAQTRWYDAGAHLDMTSMLARDKINLARDYALMGTEIWCGKTYALPMDADPNAVFYNKTLLQKAGIRDPWADGKGDWTLDEMIDMARRVTQDTDRDGKVDQWGIAWAYTHPSHVAQFIWTKGGDVADFNGMKYILDQAASMEGHQQIYNWLVRDRLIISNTEASEIQRQYTKTNPFRTGRVAFHVRAVADVRQNAREIGDSFEWDVLPFPKFNASRPGIPLVSGNPHSVVKESKVAEAAYQWAKHIAGPKGQEVLARTQSLPALKSKQQVFLTTPPNHVKVFQDVYNKPYGIHFRHHFTNDSWAIYSTAINKIYGGEAPLQGALQEANRQMNDTVKIGDCAPYRGMTIPIRPK
jgi:multiple sugar transport system substrate-binding protein